MRGKRLTKLQLEYLDKIITHGAYIAYPTNIFQSDNYLKWRRERRANLLKKKFRQPIHIRGNSACAFKL